MARTSLTSLVLAVVFAVVVSAGASSAFAQAQPKPNPNPTAAASMKTAAEASKKKADDLTKEAAGATAPKAKEALEASATAYRAQQAAQEQLGKAYEAGVAADITKASADANAAADKARRAEDRARTLLAEAIYRDSGPVEAWRKGTPAGAMPTLDALLVARAKTADALVSTAEALASSKTMLEVEEIRDKALEATNDYNVALRVYNSAKDTATREERAAKAPTPDAARKAVEKLKTHDNNTIAKYKQQLALTLEVRKLDRARAALAAESDNTLKK